MSFRIAINGYGRIGRCVLRALYERGFRESLAIAAVNDIADNCTMAYLTEYDTTHGRFPGSVCLLGEHLVVNGDRIRLFSETAISDLPWSELGIDAVLECSGAFSSRHHAEAHLRAGATKVLFSQPADPDVDATIVYGVNHSTLKKTHHIVSNASCTTNCLIPVLKVIDDAFGIRSGVITTIHSAMNDQPVIDAYHHTDLRRTRCSSQSIIPVDTQLARGIGRVLPHLDGRFEATAVRVPTINVSAMDIVLHVEAGTDANAVNGELRAASETWLHGVLGFSDGPLVSWDFNHDSRSSIVDGTQTRVSGGSVVKIFAWFDNEWAYAVRMLDTTCALLAC